LVQFAANDFPSLLTNSALFIREMILERVPARPTRTETVELESPDEKELLMDWLRELLYLFSTRSFVTLAVEVKELKLGSPSRLKAVLSGADYDQSVHGLKLEIKTPTYHQFSLERSASGFSATVLFDV